MQKKIQLEQIKEHATIEECCEISHRNMVNMIEELNSSEAVKAVCLLESQRYGDISCFLRLAVSHAIFVQKYMKEQKEVQS
jgi:hypothetical protein